MNSIKKYRVTASKKVEADDRAEAIEEFMDYVGAKDSDLANAGEFKSNLEVIRVG